MAHIFCAFLLVRDIYAKMAFVNTNGKIHPFKISEKLEILFIKHSMKIIMSALVAILMTS